MHDVAWRCDMNCVRSKDAYKQLARTTLEVVITKIISAEKHGFLEFKIVVKDEFPCFKLFLV